MMIVLLAVFLVTIYAVTRRLLGPMAALAALALAAVNPALLAHGRLVTTDVPIALAMLLFLWSFCIAWRSPTVLRFTLCGLALAAAALVKYSWPLVLPAALVVMLLARWAGRESTSIVTPGAKPAESVRQNATAIPRPAAIRRVLGLLLLVAIPWIAIWSAFAWRFSPMPDDAAERTPMMPQGAKATPAANLAESWERLFAGGAGRSSGATTATLVRLARDYWLLPEAYLYGLLYTARSAADPRYAYLAGRHSDTGFLAYFPAVLALKLPLGTLALAAVGVIVIVRRRGATRDPLLLVGLTAAAALYLGAAIISGFDLGERHIIAIYPLLFACGGAAVAAARGWRRATALGLLGWSCAAGAMSHPQHLSYFNELAGGTQNAQRWLLDSNLDWGQDLMRLAAWRHDHPAERLVLLYFGGVAPRAYDIDGFWLEDSHGYGNETIAVPGTYVISATELHGVYNRGVRDAFWEDLNVRWTYTALHGQFARGGAGAPGHDLADFHTFQRLRLINQLQHRAPDERIGHSLFVYRVTPSLFYELTQR